MRGGRQMLAVLAAAMLAAPAAAQEENLGTLQFSGAPTIQEIQAQQKACEAKRPPRKTSGALSETTYRRLERIMDNISKNQYSEAEQKLNEMINSGSRSDYEKAILLQTLAFVYASTKREMQGVKAFEQAVATNALPQQVHEQMMFNIAQLYFADDKWDTGMERLNAYMAETCNPNPEAHALLAAANAEKKRFREALKQIDLAIVKAKPKESWLAVKLALHYELHEFPRCAEVLVHLVALNPMKEEYFKQLHSMLFEIKKDPESLAVLSLAERRGYINEESEYRNLANMYMYMQIPLKAATLMERGIAQKQVEATEKNLDFLATAWLVAREYDKAEVAMSRAAAASDKGELYKRLGQIQMEGEKWKAALASLQKAQQKGGLKDPGETAFLIGVVAVQLKDWKTAEAALKVAMQHEKTTKMAAEWLNHLQAEFAYSQQPAESTDESSEPQTN
jgi:tetratricopeptide (TPR) repeat protein